MSQTIALTATLGAAKTGLAIGYRVLNLDRTTYSAFATAGVAESPAGSGTYHVSGGVTAPDAGGYIVVGVSGTDYAEAPIDPAPPTVAAIQSGLSTLTTGDIDARLAAYDPATGTEAAAILAAIAALNNLSSAGAQAAAAAALAAYDAATGSDVSALNNLSSADVQAAAAAALTAYDPPTKGELDAAIATIAAAVWAHATRTLTTSSGGASAAEVWSYLTASADTPGSMGNLLITRLDAAISQIAASVAASNPASYDAGTVTMRRGVTFDATLTGVAIIPVDWTFAMLTLKNSDWQPDDDAILQIRATNGGDANDGLVRLNGSAATTKADASLVIDRDAGTVGIHIEDAATAQIAKSSSGYWYDVKFYHGTSDSAATAPQRWIVSSAVTLEV